MKIDRSVIIHIMEETSCEWTRGYLACILDETPKPDEQAKKLIDSHGPTQKIATIKAIRATYGLGLREAKAVVDEYFATGKIVGLPDEDNGASGVIR